jgi:hypothetical protein
MRPGGYTLITSRLQTGLQGACDWQPVRFLDLRQFPVRRP